MKKRGGQIIDRTGQKCGLLTAVRRVEQIHSAWRWLYRCECGQEKVMYPQSAKRAGHCGCKTVERQSAMNIKHGHGRAKGRSREYVSWYSMKQRCLNPKHKKYPSYGGRGIRLCARWHQFSLFLEDMGPKPTPDHTINRINNDGDYEPSNCCWATRIEQQSNMRSNRMLVVNGVAKTMSQWARDVGVNPGLILKRLQSGWSVEDAVLVPRGKFIGRKKHVGQR